MVDIVWLGHGSFQVTVETGEVFLIDPWVTGNPKYPTGHTFTRVDGILITHGHSDHTADVVRLAKEFLCDVVAIHEVAEWLGLKGVSNVRGMNKGGTQVVGPLRLTMTQAIHSSSVTENGQIVYLGEAAGYVLTFADGRVAYFAGDTTVFGDMALIAELYRPSLVFLPIGDHYTMGVREAALACRLLSCTTVFPMHWGTFPVLVGNPDALRELVPGVKVLDVAPGEVFMW